MRLIEGLSRDGESTSLASSVAAARIRPIAPIIHCLANAKWHQLLAPLLQIKWGPACLCYSDFLRDNLNLSSSFHFDIRRLRAISSQMLTSSPSDMFNAMVQSCCFSSYLFEMQYELFWGRSRMMIIVESVERRSWR